jgi:hypothetical protein
MALTLDQLTAQRDALIQKMDGTEEVRTGDRTVRKSAPPDMLVMLNYLNEEINRQQNAAGSGATFASFRRG